VSAIGGGATHWAQYLPVYLVPGLLGAAAAAFLYNFLAEPRLVETPIKAAVTHADTASTAAAG
jgi:hypothetical protein